MERRSALGAALSGTLLALGAAGPAEATETGSAEANRRLLQGFVDALTAHDMEKFKGLYVTDGYVQHQALPTNAASLSGREAVVSYFSKRIEAFPDLVVTCDVSLTAGDLICANLIYVGTHKGEYLGVAPTGKRVTFNSTDIIKVRDGKFVEHWGAADLFGLVQQLRS
jgi:predicted ester cyclase